MIFDKLRKDFHMFFNLDLYYASVCYASQQAYNKIDESIIERAANYVAGGGAADRSTIIDTNTSLDGGRDHSNGSNAR